MIPENMITDRTAEDVAQNTAKGNYNADDLNRVGRAVNYLVTRFREVGYYVPSKIVGKTDWTDRDLPLSNQLAKYAINIRELQQILGITEGMPIPPRDVLRLTYKEANDIEEILVDIDQVLTEAEKGLFYSGEIYAGEV